MAVREHTKIEIESPGVEIAVLKQDDDGWKFLLLKRAEQESYAGTWGFITGGKRGEETVAQVVVREMKEEVGVTPEKVWATEYLVQFYEPEYDKIWVLPLIVAVVPSDAEIQLSNENADFLWLTAAKARHRVNWKNLVSSINDISEELEIYPAHNWVELHP